MAGTVTLDDIARAAGLSKATVSRALSGHPRVAGDTRTRISKLARDLGWRPDAALSALARRRWPDGRRPTSTKLIYLHNLRSNTGERLSRYKEIAAEAGYDLQVARLDSVGDPRGYGQRLEDSGVRGIILHSVDDRSEGAPQVQRCARVVIGFGFEDLPLHRVMADHSLNLRVAVEKVRDRGYRRIGFLGTVTASERRRRLLADHFFLMRMHLEADLGPQPSVHWHQGGSDTAPLEAWIAQEQPDVIVADHVDRCEDVLGLGASARRLGLVGLVNRSRLQRDEALSQISVRRVTAFRHALHILHDAILREEFDFPQVPVRILIPGSWHEGHTLPGKR